MSTKSELSKEAQDVLTEMYAGCRLGRDPVIDVGAWLSMNKRDHPLLTPDEPKYISESIFRELEASYLIRQMYEEGEMRRMKMHGLDVDKFNWWSPTQ